ncbi:uncharacterized protein LOC117584222 [Drosophila guanche]|uniref:uncharacterized protein LOC117584222 n=1 Tax=Drosophila guanche TaxID=7266 RepID=UPI001471AE23|nr:uncharacterized protein LOC117584222 [Drosophila guanche]
MIPKKMKHLATQLPNAAKMLLWKWQLPWFGTLLLLVLVGCQKLPSGAPKLSSRGAPVRAVGDAIAELEIGPHGNPSSLLKIFNPDAQRVGTPLSPAITLELKGMRLLLRSHAAAAAVKKVVMDDS